MDVQRKFVSFTPKGVRMLQLQAEGMSFDEAFAIADREFTSDGLALSQMGEAAAQMEVHA